MAMNMLRNRVLATAIVALALSGAAPPAWSMDGAILVVSATDGPMPAPVAEAKVRQALQNADIRFSAAQLSDLSQAVTRALARPGGNKTICVSGGSPCIMLVRQ